MAQKLGPVFWENFLSLSGHAVAALLAARLPLRFKPWDESADVLLQVQTNCRTARDTLREQGFQVASSHDSRVMCTWCWSDRAGHSTSLKAHLVACEVCPELRGNAYCCILHTVAYLHTEYLLHTVAYLHTSAGRAGGCECVAYLVCSRALHTLLHTGR